jgi:solute carrier family 14 (urea transporter)
MFFCCGSLFARLKTVARNPVFRFAGSCLRSISQVVFINNPFTGLLILLGIYFSSVWLGFAGTFGVVVSVCTALIFGFNREGVRSGLYGFNGVLVGLALAAFSVAPWDMRIIFFIFILSITGTLLTEALNKIFISRGIPSLTLPFNIIVLLFFAVTLNCYAGSQTLLVVSPPPLPEAAAGGLTVSSFVLAFNAVFRGFGQLFLANSPLGGIMIIIGITVASRMAGSLAFFGSVAGMLAGILLGADNCAIYNGLWGFNPFVSAIAINIFFSLTPRRTILLGIGSAAFAALLYHAISILLAPWSLPALTLPFCLGTLTFILYQPWGRRLWLVKKGRMKN